MQLIQDRRALHAIPELDKDLPKTRAYLQTALMGLNCTVFAPTPWDLCAYFDFGRDHAIAFRSDMDALPIRENTGLPFASRHEGCMHACGHDGHMAILLELARRLSGKKTLGHNVLLIFQSAEETTGGAKGICQTGILQQYNVQAIFALHLWPGQEAGTLSSRPGEMMSRSCELTVTFSGKSAHVAKADEGIDALAAAVEFHARAAALEQSLPAEEFRLLKFGKLTAGTVRNAIAAEATLLGSLRTFREETFSFLRTGLAAIAADIEKKTGCRTQITLSSGYPAVLNPPALFNRVEKAVSFHRLPAPSMITEDFSWYQQYVPGLFFFLGTGDTPALHADNFTFDEALLYRGADFFTQLAEAFI